MRKGLVLLLFLPFLLAGCTDRPQEKFVCIMPPDVELHPGDVVFRMGTGIASRVIKKLDPSGRFSHSGIVVDSMGKKMIIHAVADEHDYEGDVDRVKMDTPEVFFSSMYAECGEVCRPVDESLARKTADVAMEVYRRRVLFDHDYDDTDTTRMYCTEMVLYCFDRAGGKLVGDERHDIQVGNFHTRCMFPSDVYRSEMLKSIYQFYPNY